MSKKIIVLSMVALANTQSYIFCMKKNGPENASFIKSKMGQYNLESIEDAKQVIKLETKNPDILLALHGKPEIKRFLELKKSGINLKTLNITLDNYETLRLIQAEREARYFQDPKRKFDKETKNILVEKLFDALDNNSNIKTIMALIEEINTSVNCKDSDGIPLIYYACLMNAGFNENNLYIIKWLLKNGADPNEKIESKSNGLFGHTAISLACERGSLELVKTLIEGGGQINNTHIELAKENKKHPDVLEYLLTLKKNASKM
jgi:ankyrin repeat protein